MGSNNSSGSSSPTELSSPRPPARKQAKLEDPIKSKLGQYLDQFASAVRSGEFVVQRKLSNVPFIGVKVVKTGKLLKFPLQEDEVSLEELAGSRFEVQKNKDWVKLEASIVDQVASGFGFLDNRISVSLKKFVIQKSGSRFPTNLDAFFNRSDNQGGEGSPSKRCFGHLVVQLPSHYSGGHIRFEHEGQLKEFDMSASVDTEEGLTAQYLAFYPQVGQDHGEILSGVRSCFIYNLEIESSSDAPPRAPTIRNIVPSFPQIIQEWNQRSDKVPLICNDPGINPTAISTFLAPTLSDNGVTLFHGTIIQWACMHRNVEFSTRLRILASPDAQVEEAFRLFLRDEPIDEDGFYGIQIIDDRGLKFDLGKGTDCCKSDNLVFFLSEGENVDLFENESWIKDVEFWRFQSYLFLQKCADLDALLRAAEALVSLEIDQRNGRDLFINLPHFKNVLDKFFLLEDTILLRKLLKICADQSNFDTLFPTLLQSGMPWPILQSGLEYIFHPAGVETWNQFSPKVEKFASHVEKVFHVRDNNCEEFYFNVLDSLLQKFPELPNVGGNASYNVVFGRADSLTRHYNADAVTDFVRISEVLEYNLFKFVKSQPAPLVQEVMLLSSGRTQDVSPGRGVMWVKLVTDLYCCTNFLENWPNEEVQTDHPPEGVLLLNLFTLAEKVGADVKGLLGNVNKYGVIVRTLERVALDNKQPGVLSKFWIPFATRLEARIEAVLFPDGDTTRPDSSNFSVREGTEMLENIRKLLESAKQQ